MISFLDGLYIKAMIRLNRMADRILHDENGDTNFISIIIVLGIVLALVVVFRGYITDILGKISNSVKSFNNNPFKK